MKVFFDERPEPITPVGNGSYLFRYFIDSEEVQTMEGEEPRTHWFANEVVVWELSSNAITKAVISDVWDPSYEQKLINEYIGVQCGIYEGKEAEGKEERLLLFLNDRYRLKAEIDRVCASYNIV